MFRDRPVRQIIEIIRFLILDEGSAHRPWSISCN
jgi:hypothetical protein